MSGARRLLPCPQSPNCVSSLAADTGHRVEPLRYKGTRAEAKERVVAVLRSMKRVKIVVDEPAYVQAECTSALVRFIDDVEFLFSESEHVIHVRSASRVGYYDFGVNRDRIEHIRKELAGR